MERAVTEGHTAAWLAGTQERLGISERLLHPRNLSRAERADIQRAVADQLRYLRRFGEEREALSEAATKARAEMYARAVSQTYQAARWGDWEIPDDLMPGRQQCLTNCRCAISVKDNGDGTGILTRTMGGERHCAPCEAVAGDHEVKRRHAD